MPIVEFESVTKTYKSGKHVLNVLDNVSLSFESGKPIVILGPSDAGKSTLLNMRGSAYT